MRPFRDSIGRLWNIPTFDNGVLLDVLFKTGLEVDLKDSTAVSDLATVASVIWLLIESQASERGVFRKHYIEWEPAVHLRAQVAFYHEWAEFFNRLGDDANRQTVIERAKEAEFGRDVVRLSNKLSKVR